jgi:hypothetical protein
MPSEAQHIWQAEHNEEVFRYLGDGFADYRDWQVTMLFYSMVHYVNAYLVHDGAAPESHQARELAVNTDARLRSFSPQYRELTQRCWEARYGVIGFNMQATISRNLFWMTPAIPVPPKRKRQSDKFWLCGGIKRQAGDEGEVPAIVRDQNQVVLQRGCGD